MIKVSFEKRYLEKMRDLKYVIMGEYAHYVSNLGMNYTVKIKLLMQFLVFFRRKIKETENLYKKHNIKTDFNFELLKDALDIIILNSGFKSDESSYKLLSLSLNAYCAKNKFELKNINTKYEELHIIYQYLKSFDGFYHLMCKQSAKTIGIEKEMFHILRYTGVLASNIEKDIEKKVNKYQQFVGVNLKTLRNGGIVNAQ